MCYDESLIWWRHQMEAFSPLLALCAGNSPVTGEVPAVTRNFDVLFDLWMHGWVNNREAGDLRRHRAHYDVNVMKCVKPSTSAVLRTQCTEVTAFLGWIGIFTLHDDVIKWKQFARYWPFVRGIHRSPVNSPHNGQWRGALMFSLMCARINGWVNNVKLVIWDAIALIMA